MLVELQIEGFALIEDQALELHPGLNVISGASGAGKSLILQALTWLLGARSAPAASEKACVRGLFGLPEQLAARLGVAPEVVLERQLTSSGRSRCLLDRKLVARPILAELGDALCETHSQDGSPLLRSAQLQTAMLDDWAGSVGLAAEVAELRGQVASATRRLKERERAERGAEQRAESQAERLAEIRAVRPEAGELVELERRLAGVRALAHSQEGLRRAAQCLDGPEGAALDRLAQARRALASAHGCEALHARLDSALADLQDLVRELDSEAERLLDDARECRRLEERYRALRRLSARHAYDLDAVLEEEQALAVALEAFAARPTLDEERAALGALRGRLEAERRRLRDARLAAGEARAPAILARLAGLGLEDARLLPVAEGDEVSWWFSAQPDREPRPLKDVASGGELCRIALALREQAAGEGGTLLVFDEIDSPLGGRLGHEFGRCLRNLAERHQVVCITHLPQVASFADRHLLVQKVQASGRTVTQIQALDEDQRLAELAHMLRGEGATSVTLSQARELVRDAARSSAGSPVG